MSHKVKNKLKKITNGNIARKTLRIFEWNIGSRHWTNKQVEIQRMVDDHNIFKDNPDYKIKIVGYNLELPLTWNNDKLEYARIAVLIKEDLNYEILKQYMSNDISTIWVKINRKGRKKLIVGGIYREFKFIRQTENEEKGNLSDQNDRWRRILNQWEAATNGADSVIIGDCNLDYNCWEAPTGRQVEMIETTKSTIGSSGLYQVIRSNTHTWPGARDSLIDHCWVNSPEKVMCTVNVEDASSDHNIIGISLRISGVSNNSMSFKKRKWKNFDAGKFNLRLSQVNWDNMYQMTEVNLAWDYLQSTLIDLLKEDAPVVTCQPKTNHRVWLSQNTKDTMLERDTARSKSKVTNTVEDKSEYKKLRNKATKEIKADRNKFLKKQYEDCEMKNDSAKLYSIAKNQAGWKTNSSPTSLVIEGQNITSPRSIAQEQMKFYQKKNSKLLEGVEGGNEINPLETLKLAVNKWTKAGKYIPKLSLREISQNYIVNQIKKDKRLERLGI